MRIPTVIALAASSLFLQNVAAAQCVVQKIQTSPGGYDHFFGVSVVTASDVIYVGQDSADRSGAVKIFQPSGVVWTETASITASDAATEKAFGRALAASGGTLVVGSPSHPFYDPFGPGPVSGAAYVFERVDPGTPGNPLDDTWSQVARLEAPAPALEDWFGSCVSCSGDTILVGAPGVDWPQTVAGKAYLFVRNDAGTPANRLDDTWSLQATFVNPTSGVSSRYGRAVKLIDGGTTALVGDPTDTSGAIGGVFRFGRGDNGTPANPLDDTWNALGQIEAPMASGNVMGDTIEVSGVRMLVAGVSADGLGLGKVYSFTWNDAGTPGLASDDSFTLDGVISNPTGGVKFGFGSKMALSGDRALITPRGWSFGPPSFGFSTFEFERVAGTWTFVKEHMAPDQTVNDGFGTALALNDGRALIAAPGGPYVDDDPAVKGAVYDIDLDTPSPWSDSSLYEWPHLAGFGFPSPGLPAVLRVHQSFQSNAACFIVMGASQINAPMFQSVLVPYPHFVIGTALDANAERDLTGAWPAGFPTGVSIYIQALVNIAPGIYSLTNTITVTGP